MTSATTATATNEEQQKNAATRVKFDDNPIVGIVSQNDQINLAVWQEMDAEYDNEDEAAAAGSTAGVQGGPAGTKTAIDQFMEHFGASGKRSNCSLSVEHIMHAGAYLLNLVTDFVTFIDRVVSGFFAAMYADVEPREYDE